MKKFAGERARLVANEQVIHAAARSRIADQAAAQHLRANGVHAARSAFANPGKVDAVFVAKRRSSQEGLEMSEARVSREFPRAAARRLSGTSVRSWASRTFLVYITHR